MINTKQDEADLLLNKSRYDFISDNETVAVKGKNVMLAKDDINTIIAKNPTNLYLLFGMNDLECFGDVKDFKVAYEELLKSVLLNDYILLR